MATYKLIQDIEAEDKILGPLTFRQFVFGLIAIFFIYISWFVISKGLAFFSIIFLPPALFFGFFALPLGRDQPTEIWALAKIRYYFKPRKRIWNQSGVKELVTINAPKKVERFVTNGLSPTEVDSRLRALANTIDSRGWAVKNVNVNSYAVPIPMPQSSDRLIDPTTLPQAVPETDIVAADDILDEKSNPIAMQFDSMINQSNQERRQQLYQQLNGSQQHGQPRDNYWFMNNQSQNTPIQMAPAAAKIDPKEEAALVARLKNQSSSHPAPYSNLRTVKPLNKTQSKPAKTPVKSSTPPMTAPADPAILSLADNDDLNVSTLAREAKRAKGEDDQNEVVVPLR